MRQLKLILKGLERFDDDVVLDLSAPLTVVVGPNGSGKSTVLEATAEVLTFLQTYVIEGPADEVRKKVRTSRSTRPGWLSAVIETELSDGVQVGQSLAQHFPPTRRRACLTIEAPRGNARWRVAAISLDGSEIQLAEKDLVVDSRRKAEADLEIQDLTNALATYQASITQQTTKLTNQLAKGRRDGATPQILGSLQQQLNTLNDQMQERRGVHDIHIQQLRDEAAAARKSAIRLADGTDVVKTEVEAFICSLEIPQILYLQGQPDFGSAIARMASKLGTLKDKRRSEESGSEYNRMRARINSLLKMHVTIDKTERSLLLVNDRPTDEVSAGTWNALGFVAACEEGDPNALIIWDEPETGLHPTWANQVCSLMLEGSRQFMVATHRTEFVPIDTARARIYRSTAKAPTPGEKTLCQIADVPRTLAQGLAIAAALGLEPARILFTTNAVLWVEGPSDVIYWRFWLRRALQQRNLRLVEGFDFSFMFSGGSLLAHETLRDDDAPLSEGTVNLLNFVGASRVIVDSDFNPTDKQPRISEGELNKLVSSSCWRPDGFVTDACLPYLKPRVRAIASALKELDQANPSSISTTWGREAENGLSDDAFRRTLRSIHSTADKEGCAYLEELRIDPWTSYEQAIADHLAPALEKPELRSLTVQLKGETAIAQESIVNDKIRFAHHYTLANESAQPGSDLRPEAQELVAATLDWILKVRQAYLQ